MNNIANWLTMHIKDNVSDLTDLQLIKIKFGIECLLSEASKTIIYILFFSFLSLTTEFLVAFLFFTAIRVFAGGYHEETYWRCFITSLLFLGSCIFLGLSLNITIYGKIAIIIFSAIIAYIFSPVDHPNKPIISEQRRKKLKYLSIGVIIMLGLIGINLSSVYSNIAILAILVESISLILGYMKKKYVYH
ncbi:accessory gene regulator ArgB-like protein [Lutispora sp.]|uniref:accessory gene regulator ArgB-like protein n=1 Tax=Lutispora sp. TaxID=2828727 RepID=UPI00356985F6